MTISGTGILWIVNRFLASLVRLDSFDVSSRRIRPRSICSRDCPSIISQIDSNEYPDCRTPRFSADHPFHFIPRDAYTFVPSNGFTRGKGKKKNSSSSSISFSRMENLSFRTYLSPNVSNLKLPIFFSVSSDSQGSSWEKRGCVRTKGARIRSTLLPRAVVSLFLFLSSHTKYRNKEISNLSIFENSYLVRSMRSRRRKRTDSRAISGKDRLDPRPDSWKYMETSSIRLGYYRGLGHRTGFLESSAKCAPDWTDTKDVVPPGYAINRHR